MFSTQVLGCRSISRPRAHFYLCAGWSLGVLCLPSSMKIGAASPLVRRSALLWRWMGNSLTLLTFPCSPRDLQFYFIQILRTKEHKPLSVTSKWSGWMLLHQVCSARCVMGEQITHTADPWQLGLLQGHRWTQWGSGAKKWFR